MQRKLLKYIFCLVFYFCLGYSLEFQTIGIYSLCNDNHKQDEFTQYGHAMDAFADRDPFIKSIYDRFRGRTSYKSFDVCYSHEKLTSTLVELLLNSTFYAVNTSDTWEFNQGWWKDEKWLNFTITARRSTMIIRLITHIPAGMLQTLLDVMSLEEHIVTTLHSPLITITEQMEKRGNFFNMKSQYGDLKRFLTGKEWRHILVLRPQTYDYFYTPASDDIVRTLATMNEICVKTYSVKNEIKLREAFDKEFLQSNETNHLIVIDAGTPYGIGVYNINESASYFKNIIDMDLFARYQEVPRSRYSYHNKRQMILLYKKLRIANDFEASYILLNMTKLMTKEMKIYQSTLNLLRKYRTVMSYYIHSTRSIDIKVKKGGGVYWYLLEKGRKVYWSDMLESFPGRFALTYGDDTIDDDYWNIPKKTVFHGKSKCFYPTCQKGTEKLYGQSPKWATPWDEEIGYFCQPCKQNFIKPSIGDERCQPCTGHYVSNKQKTKCIDPLQPVHHMITDTSGVVTLTICIVGEISCLLALVLFIKDRQTTIVKLSDFPMSIIHLLSILSFFCSTPVLYFLLPKKEMCMARTLSIALFYNLNPSVILTKSNKLLKAFSTNIRSTKHEVLKTQLSQAFTILMNVLSTVFLLIAFWSYQLPEIKVRIDLGRTQRFLHCSNGYENVAVSGLMLCIHSACFIQAFRCRKLPGHLNEAMNIVYASFISTISLCVMFPIYFSQKSEEDGELVVILVLTGNSLILFLFMYAKKLFIIVFKPEKNTKEYFRAKQMEVM